MTEWVMLGISAALVAACGVFVAGEFALLTVDRPAVERLARGGDRRARGLQRALTSLSTQLSGVQLAITLTNLVIGLLAEPAITGLLDGPLRSLGVERHAAEVISIAVALVLSGLITMLFGELLPKNLAIAAPMALARWVQAPVRGFSSLMHWPIRLLNGSANAVLRLGGLQAREELASARSAEELVSLVRHSADEGTLPAPTAELVVHSLALSSRRAGEMMVPRPSMRTVPADTAVAGFFRAVRETGRSRLPVVAPDGRGSVLGVIDLDRAVRVPYERRRKVLVRSVMAAPVEVPASLPADDVLTTMQRRGVQLVIVIDEYGDTAGLITSEDVIEELVGELADEFEFAATDAARVPGGWEVSGLLRPDEIAEATGVTLPDGGPYVTVGGLVMDRLGRLPAEGDAVEVDGMLLTVVRMRRRRVDTVRMSPVQGPPPAAGKGAS